MSRWRAVWLVARREILERGRSRAFIASLGLTVAIILAGIFLPAILAGPDQVSKVGIAGTPPPAFAAILDAAAASSGTKLVTEPVTDEVSGESRVNDGSLDALLVVPTDGSAPTYVVKERKDELLAQVVAASLSAARVQDLLDRSGVDQAAFVAAQAPPTLRELQPSDPNRDASFIFANVGVILLFISIFTFGTWVLTGVVEEKQSRVVEVVLSTVQPRDLLVGKVFGIGLLGLAQLVIMVAVGLGAGAAGGRFTLPATTAPTVLMLLLWFILGYALYSTALGVLGALASRMEEASNASSPVSIVASGAYVFALLVALDDPSGTAARIASLIPPVAPMVVPLRAALGAIEPWEIILSAALTAATIWALLVFGGRVYSGAVLQTAGRTRLRDAWRAARR
jgi:ABC-2 type transport system permease protein